MGGSTKIWMNHSSVSSKSLRSKIEYNLALAAEMTGDLNLATEWGVKSFKSKYHRNTEFYLKHLNLRRSRLEDAAKNLTSGLTE